MPALLVSQAGVALAAPAAPNLFGAMTKALAAQLSANANKNVIIVMQHQFAPARAGSAAMTARNTATKNSQAGVFGELSTLHAGNLHQFSLVNALSAKISADELTRLRANPAVKEIVPDGIVHGPALPTTPAPAAAKAAASPTPHNIPGACPANALAPEGLALTNTASHNASQQTAATMNISGAGVTVAYIADGIDPGNINFTRPDGSQAVQNFDFTGDAPGTPTSGDEAFLDANTIVGQGHHVYNVSGFSAQADPNNTCNTQIRGVAPGASVLGLNVFGTTNETTESAFLQAINFAVSKKVQVLNESFGSNPFPDVTDLDVTKQFNDAAVAAGVTVSVSSGDAGFTNTIGSPSSDPAVLSVGATTQMQFYAQANYALGRDFATTGWISNNISSLSSGGFTQTGRTVDLVAPGDLSWASCTASNEFQGCVNFLGKSSPIEEAGGTSESAPFISGAAALVIQAYALKHNGIDPSPAVVKQILTSTATDLREPAQEMGAGLLNSLKAVQLAESFHDANGGTVTGSTLALSTSQVNEVGTAGTTPDPTAVSITNEGTAPQTVSVQGRAIGPNLNVQKGSVTLTDGKSQTVTNFQGLPNNFAEFHFKVGANQARLQASLAYPGNPANGNNQRIRMILIDPTGKLAAHSLPQGVGNFGNVDVRLPAAGTWTGVIFGINKANGGTNGTVPWQVTTEQFAHFGTATPSSLTLAPGATGTVQLSAPLPASPGDASGAFVVSSANDEGAATSIPVTLRSKVDLSKGGTFKGTLTGGNGRANGEGQQDYYQFDVPSGVKDLTANVSLTNDAADPVGAYLISPDGDVRGYGQNTVATSVDSSGNVTVAPSLSLTAYTLNPVAGPWTLIVDFAEPVVGNEITQTFTGNIVANQANVSAAGLPDDAGTTLPAGQAVTVPVKITNNGKAPQDFFIDPRLTSTATVSLVPLTSATNAIPLSGVNPPEFIVPTETSSLSATQTSSAPAMFDFSPFAGDPDIASAAPGTTLCDTSAAASFAPTDTGTSVTTGVWSMVPAECGPFSNGATAGSATDTLNATIRAFDPAVTSDTGDFWEGSVDPNASFGLFVIQPGQTATINVTITPSGTAGTVVSGDLFVDTFDSGVPPFGQLSGDEVAALPYSYTIGS